MSVNVRPAVQSDIPYLYSICLETGNSGKNATPLFSDPWLIGQYYAAPYLFYDQSLCFIAEKDDIPKGYILGTNNTIQFNNWLHTQWLPPLRLRYPIIQTEENEISKMECNLRETIHKKIEGNQWVSEYPAHLHIDLLPELQGKGIGRSLINVFLNELKTKKCTGIHLGVNSKNSGAIEFYKKMDFLILQQDTKSLIMGKHLD